MEWQRIEEKEWQVLNVCLDYGSSRSFSAGESVSRRRTRHIDSSIRANRFKALRLSVGKLFGLPKYVCVCAPVETVAAINTMRWTSQS